MFLYVSERKRQLENSAQPIIQEDICTALVHMVMVFYFLVGYIDKIKAGYIAVTVKGHQRSKLTDKSKRSGESKLEVCTGYIYRQE